MRIGKYGHDNGDGTSTTSFTYTPDFHPVLEIAEEIGRECDISRSTVFKTLLADSMGVTPKNKAMHEAMLGNIKEALKRRQAQENK